MSNVRVMFVGTVYVTCFLVTVLDAANGAPAKPGVALIDQITGLYLTIGIVSALLRRERIGEAARVETSLFESQLASLANVATAALNAGQDGQRWGTAHASIVPYQAFETVEGAYIFIAAMNDAQFTRLAQALGRAAWAEDARFASNAARVANRTQLIPLIQARLLEGTDASGKARSRASWLQHLTDAGLAATPINTPAEALADAQTQALQCIHTYANHATIDQYKAVAPPIRVDGQLQTPAFPAPVLGQHTRQVLQQLAGMSLQQIKAGEAAGWAQQAPLHEADARNRV